MGLASWWARVGGTTDADGTAMEKDEGRTPDTAAARGTVQL